ncbi:MAG: chemotaxis protein CheZ [Gammaproteobacteria bacterium]|jgi:chemotaxis protein CheZ
MRNKLAVTVKALSEAIDAQNSEAVATLLAEIHGLRESEILHALTGVTGSLTSSLDAMTLDRRVSELAVTGMPDAQSRIAYVLEKTEQAANETLSAIETALPVVERLGARGADLLANLAQDMRPEIQDFLREAVEGSKQLNSNLTDALVAQGYQDLTAQVMRPVVELVQEVQEQLQRLIETYGVADADADAQNGALESVQSGNGHGPQVKSPSKAQNNYMDGQSDVDDLLSSLGM